MLKYPVTKTPFYCLLTSIGIPFMGLTPPKV